MRQVLSGEGEFISFTRTVDFTTGGVGNWTNSMHEDDFAGLAGQTLVPTSAMVKLNNGAAIAIPIAMYFYAKKHLQKPWLFILDRLAIMVALAGFFIRFGNFQIHATRNETEILKQQSVP